MSKIKQVIVVRKDLNMRKGKIAAQVAHASMAALLQDKKLWACDDSSEYKLESYITSDAAEWLDGKFTKICVYVNSEEELLEIARKAEQTLSHQFLVRDSGLTEFNNVPTYTCVALGPAWDEEIDPITGHLPLL